MPSTRLPVDPGTQPHRSGSRNSQVSCRGESMPHRIPQGCLLEERLGLVLYTSSRQPFLARPASELESTPSEGDLNQRWSLAFEAFL